MSIYKNVFSYRPRMARTPTEDFLSESLADLLNRLPVREHVSFIGNVLLRDDLGKNWISYVADQPAIKLRWETQRRVTDGTRSGIADLVLLVNDIDAIVMENKVGAGIRSHAFTEEEMAIAATGEDEAESKTVDPTQLTTYGRWLALKCKEKKWPGALVLLTKSSEPPPGYGGHGYGVPHASVCRWRQIWSWARNVGQSAGKTDATTPIWKQLAAEFATFLEGLNMSADGLAAGDIAQLPSLIQLQSRTKRTFDIISEHLSTLRMELARGGISRVDYSTGMTSVWAWFYLKVPTSANWYIGWGIRFPGTTSHWSEFEPPLPSVPHAFVTLGSEGKRIPASELSPDELPHGWTKLGNEELAVGRILSSFSQDAEEFPEGLAKWVIAEISALKPTLTRLINLSTSG